jgi:hyperosmotically inducible protein
MDRMKYAVLITAMAAAAFVTAGCEQSAQGDKVGQRSDQANPSVMGKLGQADTNKSAQPANADHAGSKASGVDDTMITTKIKAALLAEPGLKSAQINVATKDATVTLSGAVDSDIMRDRAKQIALSTEGVKNVVDNMSPKSSS